MVAAVLLGTTVLPSAVAVTASHAATDARNAGPPFVAGLQAYGGWGHASEDGPRAIVNSDGNGGHQLLLIGRRTRPGDPPYFRAPIRPDPSDPFRGLATIWVQPENVATLAVELSPDKSRLTVSVHEMHSGNRSEDVFRNFALGQFVPDWPYEAGSSPLEGAWRTKSGQIRFVRPNVHTVLLDELDWRGRVQRRFAAAARVEDKTTGEEIWTGPWVSTYGRSSGTATVRFLRDRPALVGVLAHDKGEITWEASHSGPLPSEQDGPPQPDHQPTPEPHTDPKPQTDPNPRPTPGEQASGGFESLDAFDVRFLRLERPRGAGVVRAVVTVRNASGQVQYPGSMRAILTDSDGATQERNQLWRPSGEPAALFSGTPALQPGAELTVRYTFNPDVRELRSLTLLWGREKVEFSLAGQ